MLSDSTFIQTNGSRKTATAEVLLKSGSGLFVVNGVEKTLSIDLQELVLQLTEEQKAALGGLDFVIKVRGGGVVSQAQAISHGVARAFCLLDAAYRPVLKRGGYLTRDARAKERRKYGLKKARKAPQYSKR
uniref:Small ribosomal subunit protein uS9c n=1 Tax=Xylochloris irregularis TaxID=480381 RepID=A0A097KME6_9CHLO|nr:ribosomal protein S9 [Xylochloris irregularis]AIT94353.1 ribosomal protein S9 [Xylochloris irregularis]